MIQAIVICDKVYLTDAFFALYFFCCFFFLLWWREKGMLNYRWISFHPILFFTPFIHLIQPHSNCVGDKHKHLPCSNVWTIQRLMHDTHFILLIRNLLFSFRMQPGNATQLQRKNKINVITTHMQMFNKNVCVIYS